MTTKLPLYLAVFLAALSLAGFSSARGARKALGRATEATTAYSNQLAQAREAIAQRDATIQTLNIQAELATKDLHAAAESSTNLLLKLAGSRDAALSATAELHTKQETISLLSSELASERQEKNRTAQHCAALGAELAARGSQLSDAQREVETLRQRANQNAVRYSELLKKWTDPSSLEAQLRNLRQGSPGKTLPGRGPLVLQSDGSVIVSRDAT
jgi:chromosome segregation ATPase